MRALLDVNVLIALLDAGHVHHRRASEWLEQHIADGYSLLDVHQLDWPRMLGHWQITVSHLLGLAVRHGCRSVSFDACVQPGVVAGAQARHLVSLGA